MSNEKPWPRSLLITIRLPDVLGCSVPEAVKTKACQREGWTVFDSALNPAKFSRMLQDEIEYILCESDGRLISKIKGTPSYAYDTSPHSVVRLVCPTWDEASNFPQTFLEMHTHATGGGLHAHESNNVQWHDTLERLLTIAAAMKDWQTTNCEVEV